MDELRRWRCKEGHTLGFVRRNGSGVRQLLLLREAMEEGGEGGHVGPPVQEAVEEDEVDVMAVVEGYVADVRCSICGRVRTWVPGEEALRRMLRQGSVEG